MKKIKLKNGVLFELINGGIFERVDYYRYTFYIPNDMTIEEIESNFNNPSNVDIVYIIDGDNEIIRTITGFTKYYSLEKTNTSISITMKQPDWKEKYDELKSMIDVLMQKID